MGYLLFHGKCEVVVVYSKKVFIFVVFFENMGAFLDLTGMVRHRVHVVRRNLSL